MFVFNEYKRHGCVFILTPTKCDDDYDGNDDEVVLFLYKERI